MSRSAEEVNQSIMDVGNETTYLNESQWEGLKRNLLDDFATPVKPAAPASGKSDVTSVQPGQEHMKVYLRVRPFTADEINRGENQVCTTQNCVPLLQQMHKRI